MSPKKKNPSIKKAILRILSEKKVIPFDTVKETVQEAISHEYGGQNADYAITRSIKNMVGDGLVEAFNSEHKQYFRLTQEGKQKLNNTTLDADASLVSTHWDGFWRIVLLDLPEDRKSEREALRYLLKKAGFVCIKNSVWVSMYPFEHLFTNIKKDLGLSTELIILVTNKLDETTEEVFLKLIK